ncbi:MAG: PilZ domain-containing protein [Oscillospiraceae bacterium]|jgi:hypothetical protein|nr:PilZ domain-containing protein [Oscillospiraceae bacterium]
MAALTNDYTRCTIFIYDMEGNHLVDTVITEHDKAEKQIIISNMPKTLNVNDDCKLLILTEPSPCEFIGRVKKIAGKLYLALRQGQEKESRGATRYKVNTPALIDVLYSEGKPYKLHTPVNVVLLNISVSGVRFRAPYYTLTNNDSFQMHLTIKGAKKKLIAQAVNTLDNEPDSSDYGCIFAN